MGTDRAIETTTAHSTIAGAYDPDTKRAVIVFKENSNNDIYYQVITVEGSETTTNMATDAENYLGIATKTVADDAQAEVATFGQIDAQQSGLTPGQKYFVQSDGSLATSADSSVPGYTGTVTTVAGKALSATKLLISERIPNCVDIFGYTALDYALSYCHYDCANILKERFPIANEGGSHPHASHNNNNNNNNETWNEGDTNMASRTMDD